LRYVRLGEREERREEERGRESRQGEGRGEVIIKRMERKRVRMESVKGKKGVP
jgi:hypothetical protein